MIRNNNILSKCLLLLILAMGWCSSAWAQTAVVQSINATFNNPAGNSDWTRVGITPNALDGAQNNVAGVNISVTGTAALKAPVSDITSQFLGPNHQTTGAAQTYTFTVTGLPNGTSFNKVALPLKGVNSGGANQNTGIKEVNVDIIVTDGSNTIYQTNLTNKSLTTNVKGEIHKNISAQTDTPFATTTGTMVVKFTISKGTDNAGCFMAFHGLELEKLLTLGNDVKLKFVDAHGVDVPGAQVRYTPVSGTPVELTPSMSTHSFGNVPFSPDLFQSANNLVLTSTSFDDATNTLTFVLVEDPYAIKLSLAPANGEWAEGTNWFVIRNNRNGKKGFLSTQDSGNYLDAQGNLTINNGADAKGDRGGLWAFVPNGGGINIYNNAYGPDFILGISGSGSGARMQMYPKDDVPSGVNTLFSYGENSQRDGVSHAYYFQVGTSGNNHINEQGGYPALWDSGNKTSDAGSAFKVESIDDDLIAPLRKYDVYKTLWTGAAATGSISYGDATKVFGKRGSANDGQYLILHAGSPVAVSDFNIALSDEDCMVQSITPQETPGHYYKTLNFFLKDRKATDEWTVKVNGDYIVNYAGLNYVNGERFFARPKVVPKAVDFVVNAPADKFVWGPVIDSWMRTITFEVRDRATSFQSGFYQLMLKNDADIDKANNLISKFAENENTASNYLYLAPSVYHLDDAEFKFTGVPTYGGEAATYVYIKDNGGNVDIVGAGGAEFKTLAYSFANGEISLTNYGIKNYTDKDNQNTIKYEPKEMPSLVSGAGTTTYTLNAVSLTDCEAYYIVYAGKYNAQTRFTYKKATPTGISDYGNEELLIVNKATTTRAVAGLDEADFVSDDAICTKVEVIEEPSATAPGKIRLTIEAATVEYKVIIKGDTNASDRVVYNNKDYASEATVSVPVSAQPTALEFKTNVTDRFVWGPVFDHEAKTVTFEIKTPVTVNAASGTPQTTDGWYQFMLVPYSNGATFINEINSHCTAAKSRSGSYIYMFNADQEFLQGSSSYYPAKFAAVPADGDQAKSFFYVTTNGSNREKPQLTTISGRNIGANGHVGSDGVRRMEAINDQNIYGIYRWFRYDTGSEEAPYMGASGETRNFFVRAVKVDPNTMYKVYKVQLPAGQSTVKFIGEGNHSISEVFNNGYFFLDKDSSEPTKEQFKFDAITTITAIHIDGNNVITFDVTSPASALNNTIIHRQHVLYDRLEMVSPDKKPGNNYIKKGEGLIDQPYAASFNGGDYNVNDQRIQNTSVFNITQYVKPGERTECVLPFTKSKSTAGHVEQYQRWYNYQTERPFDDDIVGSTIGSFNKFTNGHCNYNTSGNKQYNVPGKADIKLPLGTDTIQVAVDASEFQDTKSLGNGNLMEPSLNMRVIYHIISAHEMAKELTTSGNTWWEEKSYYVPNVKRGSDTYKNNADLLPLDMPFSNYWIYKTEGTVGDKQADDQLMPIVAENGNYATLGKNLRIEVEGSAAKDLDVGIFNGNPGGIGSAAFINSNHFIYYKVKGSNVTRRLPEGSQAVIKVYAKNGDDSSSPEYQLAKFTLTFQGDCEPLPITSVIGNEASTRSVDYFRSKNLKQVASMTFQEKELAFTRINSHRNDQNEANTYAFPIDFDRTSYGFSSNYTFGNYSVTRQGWGIKYQPVALYERNIKDPSNTSMAIEDDYFFYIDAAEAPGQVASVPLEGTLCAGTRLYCYGWLGSGNAYNGGGDPCGASVILQLVGRDNEDKEHIIASYMPGTLTDISYDLDGNEMRSLSYGRTPSMEKAHYMDPAATQVGVWNSIGFSFLVKKDMAYASYEMRIINNCFSTAGGDYSLDDFRIFANPPKGEVDFTTPLCSDKVRHAKVYADYDMLRDMSGVNDGDPGAKISATYCFIDASIFDNYEEGGYAIKDMFDIDETGNHILKTEYNVTTKAVADVINHAFRDALVGSRYTQDSGREDHGYHSYDISLDYESIEPYAYNDSRGETIYREQRGDGVRRIVFKEDVIRGEMQMVPKENEQHPAYWPHLRPSRTYYLMFSPMPVNQTLIDEEHTATQVFEIHSNCSFFGKFTTKDPMHVILDNAEIESDLPVKAICHGETIDFQFDMPALKAGKPIIDEAYCISVEAMDGEIVPETHGANHYRYEPSFNSEAVYSVIKDLPYDWWLGGKYSETVSFGGRISDYLAAVHPTYVYDKPKDKTHKQDGEPVNIAQAMIDFRFFYPEFGKIGADWSTVTVQDYNPDTGYGLLQSEINSIRDLVEKGIIVLHRNNYTMSMDINDADQLDPNETTLMAENELTEQILTLAKKLEDGELRKLEASALAKISDAGRLELTLEELVNVPHDELRQVAGNLGYTTEQIETMTEGELRKAVETKLKAMSDEDLQEFARQHFPDLTKDERANLVIRALNVLSRETVAHLTPEQMQDTEHVRELLRNKTIEVFAGLEIPQLRKMANDVLASLTEEEREKLLEGRTVEGITDQTELATLVEHGLAKITDNIINDLTSDKYRHFTLVPIMPSQENFVDELYIFCPEPRGVKVRVTTNEPTMLDGFASMPYPEDMTNIPVRLGLSQIRQVKADETKTLRIPVRGLKQAAKDGIKAVKLAENTGYGNYMFLTKTDDPAYVQAGAEVDPEDGLTEAKNGEGMYLRMIGKVDGMTAVYPTKLAPNPDNFIIVKFEDDMNFREGYTYRIGVNFMEKDAKDNNTISCYGTMLLDLKIVPEYQKWTGAVNNDWTNDQNWTRADRSDLHAGTAATGDKIDANATELTDGSYIDNAANGRASSLVPMYFTNVLIDGEHPAPVLYAGLTPANRAAKKFLGGLKETSTDKIIYDMEVTPGSDSYTCELFGTYVANGITFLPGAQLGNAHYLTYNKAWVEYELDVNRWYTLASPLQNTFAGEWYAPTAGGRQLTPHFYGIEYSHTLNHRFQPAIYQRSWDSEGNNPVYLKTGSKVENSYIQADWSHVYNDVKKEYSEGAFSVKVADDYMDNQPAGGKSLVRMPKADTKYTYYDSGNQTGDKADDAIAVTDSRSRLWSDKLKDGDTFSQTIVNQTAGNNFFLVGNPFMSPMDMEAFFAANPGLEKKYWIISSDQQHVSVKAETGWISTTGEGAHVAPLQGFFVKAADADQTSLTVHYTAAMQGAADQKPLLRAPGRTRAAEAVTDVIRLTAERNGASSTALIVMDEGASDDFSEGEDCEAFIDGNLIDQPTVYTSAGAMAQTINVRRTLDMVPVGIISDDEDEAVLRFDLSQSRFETVILYDRELDTCTEVFDGTEVRMDGNSHGRYFISGTMQEDAIIKPTAETRRGVWTVSGIYCGEDVKGLQPGLYIVNGVKVTIR